MVKKKTKNLPIEKIKSDNKQGNEIALAQLKKNGLQLFIEGKYDDALQEINKYLEVDPKNSSFLEYKAWCLFEKELFEDALRFCEKAIEQDFGNMRAWSLKALILSDLNKNEEAIIFFDKVLESKPNDFESWHNRGIPLLRLKKYDEALESFDKSIKIDPTIENVWGNRGIALSYLERNEEAIESFERAIQLNPNSSLNWDYKGVSLFALNRFEEAIGCFSKACEIDPHNGHAWFWKGMALNELERFEEAIHCYDTALEFDPDERNTWYRRSLALTELRWHKKNKKSQTLELKSASSPEFGVIAMLDALGVSNYRIDDAVDFIKKRDELFDFLRAMQDQIHPNITNIPDPYIATFQDTLVFCWPTDRKNINKMLPWVAEWIRPIVRWGIENGILFRGSVSIGEYLHDGSTILGPAVADAAEWCEIADWFGVILTPKCELFLVSLLENVSHDKLLKMYTFEQWFVKYQVPIDKQKKELWVISWPFDFWIEKTDKTPLETLSTLLCELPIPKGIESKYENSIAFFKWYGTEFNLKMCTLKSTWEQANQIASDSRQNELLFEYTVVRKKTNPP